MVLLSVPLVLFAIAAIVWGAVAWYRLASKALRAPDAPMRMGLTSFAAALAQSVALAALVGIFVVKGHKGTASQAIGIVILSAIAAVLFNAVGLILTRRSRAALRLAVFLAGGALSVTIAVTIFALAMSPRALIAGILDDARLAPLPQSARDAKVHIWGNRLPGDGMVRFNASAEDIALFIASSPSLRGVDAIIFSPSFKRLPREEKDIGAPSADFYFVTLDGTPSWFMPAVRVKGRQYRIPVGAGTSRLKSGDVVVDDETNTVYLYVERK